MNEVMMILYDGMESGCLFLKDPKGVKQWNSRDIARAMKRGYIKGYDMNFSNKLGTVPMSIVWSMYIANLEDVGNDTSGKELPLPSQPKTEMMFG